MNIKEILNDFEKLEEHIINTMTKLVQPMLLNEFELPHEKQLRITSINALKDARKELLPIINGIKEGQKDYERMVNK